MGRRKKSVEIEGETLLETPKEEIDRSLLKAPINEWIQTPEETFIYYDVKKCIIPFNELFGIDRTDYNTFVIAKDSYANQLPQICRYLNFFLSRYDTEHEMLAAYLNIKFATVNDEADIYFTGEDQFPMFIEYVYDILFSETIVEKIDRLVEENYLDDIENNGSSKKYVTKEKKHLESLEFTNEHIKTFLKISFGIKMITPVLFHYLAVNKITVNKTTSHLYYAFRPLFTIFGKTCNAYNKLFVYVKFSVQNTVMCLS